MCETPSYNSINFHPLYLYLYFSNYIVSGFDMTDLIRAVILCKGFDEPEKRLCRIWRHGLPASYTCLERWENREPFHVHYTLRFSFITKRKVG